MTILNLQEKQRLPHPFTHLWKTYFYYFVAVVATRKGMKMFQIAFVLYVGTNRQLGPIRMRSEMSFQIGVTTLRFLELHLLSVFQKLWRKAPYRIRIKETIKSEGRDRRA